MPQQNPQLEAIMLRLGCIQEVSNKLLLPLHVNQKDLPDFIDSIPNNH